jgi:hypothetical protein
MLAISFSFIPARPALFVDLELSRHFPSWTLAHKSRPRSLASKGSPRMSFGGLGGAVFGRTPPASPQHGLLGRMIAWHIQERAFCGRDCYRLAHG